MSLRASYVEVYKDVLGEFRWRFVHWNGDKMADSAEGYVDKRDCIHGAATVCNIFGGHDIVQWKRSTKGALRWYR